MQQVLVANPKTFFQENNGLNLIQNT